MKKAMKQSRMIYLLNAISIIAITLGAALCIGVVTLSNLATKETDNRFNIVKYATQFLNASTNLTTQVRLYAVTADEENYNKYWDEVNNLKNREKALENMRAIGITAQEEDVISKASKISNELVPVEEESMKLMKAGKKAESLELVYGDTYNKKIAEIKSLEAQLLSMIEERTNESLKVRRVIINNKWIALLIVLAVVVACQIVSFWAIRKKVIKPILAIEKEAMGISRGNLSTEFLLEPDSSEIGMLIYSIQRTKETLKTYITDIYDKLNEMSNNNFDIKIDVEYIGDFLPIKNAMTKIIRSFNGAMYEINGAAREVSIGAEQVSSGAQTLSQGATEQATAVEELVATIGRVREQLKVSADKAKNTNENSNEACRKLAEGNKEMENMLMAMKEIDTSAKKIGDIIGTINQIAMQTNILALNAAVEATRAGVSGKGFAVVAEEVRNLSNKSSSAAKETTGLIEKSLKAVEKGTNIANVTAETLLDIMNGAQETTLLMGELVNQSKEQAEVAEELIGVVDQISAVVQNNSATAEESAASSEELSSQAHMLKVLVSNFRLSEENNWAVQENE